MKRPANNWLKMEGEPYSRGILALIAPPNLSIFVMSWRTERMKIYVFGSSLTSCYWNGAATYYRGIYKNLHRLGHEITFAEPDIYKRQQHRDCTTIEYATVRVSQTPRYLDKDLAEACGWALTTKHSGLGADDWLLQ